MSLKPTSSASRVGLPDLPPLLFEGKRYQQVLNGEREGQTQRTGLMKIVDLNADTTRYVRIYDEARDPGREADVGDVFFRSFELDGARREIRIENERRQKFVYHIDSGAVSAQP